MFNKKNHKKAHLKVEFLGKREKKRNVTYHHHHQPRLQQLKQNQNTMLCLRNIQSNVHASICKITETSKNTSQEVSYTRLENTTLLVAVYFSKILRYYIKLQWCASVIFLFMTNRDTFWGDFMCCWFKYKRFQKVTWFIYYFHTNVSLDFVSSLFNEFTLLLKDVTFHFYLKHCLLFFFHTPYLTTRISATRDITIYTER